MEHSKNQLYLQTIDYLYSKLPVFHRQGTKAYKNSLKNITELCHYLGNPQQKFDSIHVGGTNGKGSSSHFLSAALQVSNYKTGLYTSPHLYSFTERIRINGVAVHENWVVDFVTNHKKFIEQLEPSFFELSVAMAFDYFAHNQVDIAVIEVGMGGEFDSTNIITPLVSLITNVSYDHTEILGKTLVEIAQTKAGIIKKNTPIVISETQPETALIFEEKAHSVGASLTFADQFWNAHVLSSKIDELNLEITSKRTYEKQIFSLDLVGNYQEKNLLGVIEVLYQLEQNKKYQFQNLTSAFHSVQKRTGLQGRWQIVQKNPWIVMDIAHNPAGWASLTSFLKNQYYENLYIIFGVSKDKELPNFSLIMPKKLFLCGGENPRLWNPHELKKELWDRFQVESIAFDWISDALKEIVPQLQKNDLLLIFGSNFIVSETRF